MTIPETTVDLPKNNYVDVEKGEAPFIEISSEERSSVQKHTSLSATISNISEQSIDSSVSTTSTDNPWSYNRFAK
uniref:Uncharacterized protein n=1 Tax=Panagrolaimus davidi TaxID=227884 RepID=A0A914PV30_9BILA